MQRSQIFVQNRVFCLPHLNSTPPSPLEYRHPFRMEKTKIMWLPDGDKFWWYVDSFWHNSRTWQTHRHTQTAWRRDLFVIVKFLFKCCCCLVCTAHSISLVPSYFCRPVCCQKDNFSRAWVNTTSALSAGQQSQSTLLTGSTSALPATTRAS